MNDLIFRYAGEKDLPSLRRIWSLSFGDSEALAEGILRDTGVLRYTVVAEEDGALCAMMAAFDGVRFGELNTSYLYALCTHPKHRGKGIGKALTLESTRRAFDRGCDAVCLHPANERLANWYGNMGFQSVPAPLQAETPAADHPLPLQPLSPEEYALLRSVWVQAIPASLLHAQALLCEDSGGGFFAAEMEGQKVLFCAETDGSGLLLRELLCPGLSPHPVAAAVAAALGAERAVYRDDTVSPSVQVPHLMFLGKEKSTVLPTRALLPFLLD